MTLAPLNSPSRCQHSTATGKRCRLAVINTHAGLCFRHLAKQATLLSPLAAPPMDPGDLRSELAGELKEFTSAQDINTYLSRLLLVLSENRVPPRRGAVLAYVCQLLLRTLPAIDRENNADGSGPVIIDFSGLPRPIYDSPPAPTTPATTMVQP